MTFKQLIKALLVAISLFTVTSAAFAANVFCPAPQDIQVQKARFETNYTAVVDGITWKGATSFPPKTLTFSGATSTPLFSKFATMCNYSSVVSLVPATPVSPVKNTGQWKLSEGGMYQCGAPLFGSIAISDCPMILTSSAK